MPETPGPYEHTGAYASNGDLLRGWIVAAAEWKQEALRLADEVADLRERLDAAQSLKADAWRALWRQPNA